MKILDWYILRRFLTTFFFVVALITLIICVIDYTEKVEDFIRNKPSTYELFVEYYLNLGIYWANFVSPLMVFISVVFFTANMAARTEIIAVLSTGVSFLRFMVPYFIGASLLALGIFGLVAYVIPKANKTRIAFENKYIKGQYFFDKNDVHIQIGPSVYAYLYSYNNANQRGDKFTLERFEQNQLRQKLTSEYIIWSPEKEKWTIHNYQIRTIGDTGETLEFGAQIDSTLNLEPKDFESNYRIQETYTLNELNAQIDKVNSRGSEGVELYLIEKYTRLASPFAILILTAIGVIVSARKARGGVGFQIALGFLLAFVYILFFMLSSGLASKGSVDPLLAVWLPNATFTLAAIVLYRTIPR